MPFSLCSWGTKGDNSISTDLGAVVAVSTTQGRQEVDIEMPADEVDINAAYEDALLAMRKKREAVKVVSIFPLDCRFWILSFPDPTN